MSIAGFHGTATRPAMETVRESFPPTEHLTVLDQIIYFGLVELKHDILEIENKTGTVFAKVVSTNLQQQQRTVL
jgi:hypothetical protein